MRDTNLRYLGYANETGESFKFIFPGFLTPSYVLAYGYCLADALYQALHWYFKNGQVIQSGIYKTFADALIFQCLASVLIPGNIIAIFVDATEERLKKMK
jgi:mitochondrial fission process protein 1